MCDPITAIIGAIGAVTSIVGMGVNAKASSDISAASQREEALRKQQMNLESQRQARQVVRTAIAARSTALTNATAQGAAGPGSSGLAGGEAQIAGQAGYNVEGVSQSNQIGNGIFAAKADETSAETLASFGTGLTSMGKIISGIQLPS